MKLPYQRMAVVADFQINLAAHTIDHAHRPVSLQSMPGLNDRSSPKSLRAGDVAFCDGRRILATRIGGVRTPVRSCNLRSGQLAIAIASHAKIKGNCPSRSLSISCCDEKLDGRNIRNGCGILAVSDYRKCTVSKYIAERGLHSGQLTACACELPRRRGVW